jgi:maltose alpha-D-glucosyltransferase/alpha-amylase
MVPAAAGWRTRQRFIDRGFGNIYGVLSDLWYKNAVFYSLNVETFMDGDGDGCGDFEGLARRLDYIESLGIDALWLAPFQPSPLRDDGYDIADYYNVASRLGSSGDFVEFMRQAESRGIRVIIDLVVNHTSDRHPWFREARESRDTPKRDWYIWSKKRPPNWESGMVFPGVQKTTWTRDPRTREWYFHRFYDHEPDLNMQNPHVREELRRIMGYWLQLGVAGFRIDALPFVIEKPTLDAQPPQLDFDLLHQIRDMVQWRRGDAVLLAEANVLPDQTAQYFAGGDGVHMMFNFWVNQHLFAALATGDARPLAEALRQTRSLPEGAQWAHFLRNHDELDLGHLDGDVREAVFREFGPEPSMQLYDRGIRRRLAPMLGDRRRVELAYSLLFSLPGTPVLRYGDEIGMGENLRLKERMAIRTPMQWSGDPQGGFSSADRTVQPVIQRGLYSAGNVNVEQQSRDPSSLLAWTSRLIRARKGCPEIGWGAWEIVPTRPVNTLAIQYTWRNTSLVCIHNLAAHPVEVTFRPDMDERGVLADVLTDETSQAGRGGMHRIDLDAYDYRWYRVGGLQYAIDREAAPVG